MSLIVFLSGATYDGTLVLQRLHNDVLLKHHSQFPLAIKFENDIICELFVKRALPQGNKW